MMQPMIRTLTIRATPLTVSIRRISSDELEPDRVDLTVCRSELRVLSTEVYRGELLDCQAEITCAERHEINAALIAEWAAWEEDPRLRAEFVALRRALGGCRGPEVAVADRFPTLHAIGLGSQLDALERICAQSQAGKHAGESILDPGADHHFTKADGHMVRAGFGYGERDQESGESHLIHAAARLLMAAACVEEEEGAGS